MTLSRLLLIACGLLPVMAAEPARALDLEDLLKDVLQEYVEDKAEQAGLDMPTKDKVKNVNLVFTGADSPTVDVFEPLYPSGSSSTPTGTGTAAERDCFNRVQDKVAWNYANNRHWNDSNIKNLCRKTTVASAPPACFQKAMFQGALWGKKNTHNMTWSLASQLCSGVNNPNTPITCLKNKLKANLTLQKAVTACATNKGATPDGFMVSAAVLKPTPMVFVAPTELKESDCYSYVQGRLAWDAARKNKTWPAAEVRKLCKGTTSKYSPGNCYSYVMHQGAKWGKKKQHIVTRSRAIDLCEGTNNANKVTTCFKSSIASGRNVLGAIKQCTG